MVEGGTKALGVAVAITAIVASCNPDLSKLVRQG